MLYITPLRFEEEEGFVPDPEPLDYDEGIDLDDTPVVPTVLQDDSPSYIEDEDLDEGMVPDDFPLEPDSIEPDGFVPPSFPLDPDGNEDGFVPDDLPIEPEPGH